LVTRSARRHQRRKRDDPWRRIIYLSPLLALGLFAVLLTGMSFREDAADKELRERLVLDKKKGDEARKLARLYGVPANDPLGLYALGETSVDRGKRLFEAKCKGCHDGAERARRKSKTATTRAPRIPRHAR
jgi:hypothetical protein